MTAFSPAESRQYFRAKLPDLRTVSRCEVAVKCPFHDDRTASMSIDLEHGVWICHACNIGGGILDFERKLTGKPDRECWKQINGTVGREDRSKGRIVIISYPYHDESGNLLYEAVRYEPKGFSQRRPDGKGGYIANMDGVQRVLYHLPLVMKSNIIFIVEGEKDADNLQKASAEFPNNDGEASYAATTNIGGACKWQDNYSVCLRDKTVFILSDNDDAGRKHVQQVAASVSKYAKEVHVINLPGLPEHGDVSNYLRTNTSLELFALVQTAPLWTASVTSLSSMNGTGFKLYKLEELLSRPEVPTDYLVDDLLIRGTVSCVVSKPKVGKSTFARGCCLAVARGEQFLSRNTRQGACIYLALEERHEEITSDFKAMGANGTEPIEVHADATPASAILALVELVRKQRPSLVVIDPLFRLTRIRDEKAYAEVYAALGPLIDLSRETNTHIMVIHHSGKSVKADPIDSPLGSTAIGGATATTIVLTRRDSYRTVQTVTRIGPVIPETVVHFDKKTRLLSIGGTRADADRKRVEDEIVAYLESAEPEQMEPDICYHVTGTNSVKRDALRSVVEDGRILRAGGGKKGDPFKYSFACTEGIPRTSVRETQNAPQPCVDIGEKLVRENREGPILVRGKNGTQIQTIGGVRV